MKPILTISILSTTGREDYLNNLLSNLNSQIAKCDYNVVVNVIIDKPQVKGGMSIGQKRNLALQSANGLYHCFIDDDDTVWENYIEKIVNGCLEDCDCVVLKGNYFQDNTFYKPFIHSIDCKEYKETSHCFERYPNHLNAIRTNIAKIFFFDEISFGEDTKWATALNRSKLLQTEASIDGVIYNYYYRTIKKEFNESNIV